MTDEDATETAEDEGDQSTDETTTADDQPVTPQDKMPEATPQESSLSPTTPETGEAVADDRSPDYPDRTEERQSDRTGVATDEVHTESVDESGAAPKSRSDGSDHEGSPDRIAAKLSALEQTITGVHERVEQLEESLEDHQRRNRHEHEELKKYALEDFAREVLRVRDNLQSAIELEDFSEGTEQRLRILDKQFGQLFTTGQLTKIEPSRGDEYDDHRHRMMNKQPSDEYEAEEIIRVADPGYAVSDRIIRPAQVVVAE